MKSKNIQGFTIFEVLVASVVVSVIMLGVITASLSLSNSARYFSASYYVSQTTQTTMNHILSQAALAVGSPGEPGIVGVSNFSVEGGASDPGSGDANTFCFHQNFNLAGTNSPFYHRWSCYTYISNNIYWCLKRYDVNNPPGSSGYSAGSRPGFCVSSDKYIGKSLGLPITELTIESQKVNFKITIKNCLDTTKTVSCVPGNTNNPYLEKVGSVSPAGHSA